jgi:hypothetical protein
MIDVGNVKNDQTASAECTILTQLISYMTPHKHKGHRPQKQLVEARRLARMEELTQLHPVVLDLPHEEKTQKEPERIVKSESWWQRNSTTNWLMIAITVFLAYVAFEQGSISNRQLKVMQNDERAWMKVSPERIGGPDGKSPILLAADMPIQIPMQIQNIGKTVAKKVEVYNYVEIVDADKSPALGWIENTPKHPMKIIYSGMFFPNDSHTALVNRIGADRENQSATADEVTGVNEGKKYLVIFGLALYKDVFNVGHWEKFCVPLLDRPAGSFNSGECAAFNNEGNVDDNGNRVESSDH